MGLLAGKVDPRAARRLTLTAVLLLAAGAGAALIFTFAPGVLGDYGARLRSIANPGRFLLDRQREWGSGLAAIRAHPLFGHPDAPNPYNLVFGLAAVSGIPILIPFAGMLGAAFRSGWRALLLPERAALAAGLLGAGIALLVTGVGESSLGARVTPAAMATLGVLSGLGRENAAQEPRSTLRSSRMRTPS
jgi:O-antigen ligase